MEDKSLYDIQKLQGISDSLQSFIDSMVEEIVLEGKPFDTQKKYLKKFSEKEGINYDKLEADINTFLEILQSLKFAFDKLQVKLAEEKGRECHISENTIKKLVKYSSDPRQPKANKPAEEIEKRNKSPYLKYGFYGVICFVLLGLTYFQSFLLFNSDNSSDSSEHQGARTDTIVVVKRDTIVKIQYSTEAEQLYRAEAENGDISAQFNLGCYYYSGEKGLQQNYSEAVKWYTKAADQGHAAAQNNLGWCYEKGHGVALNLEEAKKWYQKAAEQGNHKAKVNLERIDKIEAKAPQKTKALTGTEVGREWVDLGLPSGNRWATMNVGATSPTETGSYFSWGETVAKRSYMWRDYKFRTGGNEIDDIKLSKYNAGVSAFWKHTPNEEFYGPVDNRIRLESIDDAARQIWKGSWRMPTKDDYVELIKYCDTKWIVLDGGKAGIEVTGKNGMQIFLRAGGYWSTSLGNVNFSGEYWTSSLDEDETYCAYMLYFSQSIKPSVSDDWRRLHGRSIRPVLDFK